MRAISPEALRAELAERITGLAGTRRPVVLLDGAVPARPEEFADTLVDPLRARGVPVQRIDTRAFLRPASLRLERGRRDPDAFYEDWLDVGGLRREVLDRWAPNGPCSVLPTLRDPERDRATGADYVDQPEGTALLVAGQLLLGHGFPADLSVHLALGEATLRRELPEDEQWTLPAYTRYEREASPQRHADVLVRYDHPDRPAVLFRDVASRP